MNSTTEKGQSLVELAISFTFLIFLLAGIVEFGLVFFQYVQLRDAAQEGALYGSYCPDLNQINLRARGASTSPIDLHGVDVQVQIENEGFEGGDLKVTILYPHKVVMPFINKFIGDYVNLNATVTDTILKVDGCS